MLIKIPNIYIGWKHIQTHRSMSYLLLQLRKSLLYVKENWASLHYTRAIFIYKKHYIRNSKGKHLISSRSCNTCNDNDENHDNVHPQSVLVGSVDCKRYPSHKPHERFRCGTGIVFPLSSLLHLLFLLHPQSYVVLVINHTLNSLYYII